MTDHEPRVLPTVDGVRNPRRQSVGAVLAAELDRKGHSVKCLWKIVKDVPGGTRQYPRLLGIVNGAIDPTINELSVACDAIGIRFHDLAAKAAAHATTTIKETK